MAVTFIKRIDGEASAAETLGRCSINLSSAAVGNYVFVALSRIGNTGTLASAPSGWTQLSNGSSGTAEAYYVYGKIITEADRTTLNWTFSPIYSTYARTTGYEYSGVNPATPLDTYATYRSISENLKHLPSIATSKSAIFALMSARVLSSTGFVPPPPDFTDRGTTYVTSIPAHHHFEKLNWGGGTINEAYMGIANPSTFLGISLIPLIPASGQNAAWRTSTPGTGGSALNYTSITLGGVTAGDLAITCITRATTGAPTVVPSGWTLLHSSSNTYSRFIYYKILTSGDNTTHTWNFSTSVRTQSSCLSFSGVDQTTPIETANAVVGYSTAGGTMLPQVSCTTNRTQVVAIGSGFNTSAFTLAKDYRFTYRYSLYSVSPDMGSEWYDTNNSYSGGTMTPRFGVTRSSGAQSVGFIAAINDAPQSANWSLAGVLQSVASPSGSLSVSHPNLSLNGEIASSSILSSPDIFVTKELIGSVDALSLIGQADLGIVHANFGLSGVITGEANLYGDTVKTEAAWSLAGSFISVSGLSAEDMIIIRNQLTGGLDSNSIFGEPYPKIVTKLNFTIIADTRAP